MGTRVDEDRYDPVPHTPEDTARWLADPEVKATYDALEDEYAALSAFLGARQAVGLTQEEIARRMGTTKSAVSRLEASLGRRQRFSPTLSTLRRYADALGCKLELRLTPLPPRPEGQAGAAADPLPRQNRGK